MANAGTTADWVRQVRGERPPVSLQDHFAGCRTFFDHYADAVEKWRSRNSGYHDALQSLTQFYIPSGLRVLEIGSGTGDLLAAAKPSYGVGIDFSPAMVELARKRHPDLRFLEMAAEELDLGGEKFDYIILSDLIGFLYDIRLVLEKLHGVCHRRTRIVIHWYSRLWQPVLNLAERLGLKHPQPLVNWTTRQDIKNFLRLADLEAVSVRTHVLFPKKVPLLTAFANRVLGNLPVLRHLNLVNWVVARPVRTVPGPAPSVSVICPCRNEEGNIEQIARRLPAMGSHTELIYVEGNSRDRTLEECHRVKALLPEKDIRVFKQAGCGKGDAVRLGFAEAKGDILMILDADVSVAPEDLVQFYDALAGGKGDFINGSRLVYTMDPKAMRFLNLLGNKLFAWLLSALIGQPIKDSLCGTKVLWKESYEQLARGRGYFGEFDPFGDFDLLFGAAKLNLRIIEAPVRYRERVYGETNIHRFRDGLMLFKMSAVAAAKLYFIR